MSRIPAPRLTRAEGVRLIAASLTGILSGAARAALTWLLGHAHP
ncbi:hypothetical protein ACF061_35760 [Streptomyces sp. NPDC015220]